MLEERQRKKIEADNWNMANRLNQKQTQPNPQKDKNIDNWVDKNVKERINLDNYNAFERQNSHLNMLNNVGNTNQALISNNIRNNQENKQNNLQKDHMDVRSKMEQ